MEVEEAILVLIEEAEHVEALSFADVVYHVVLQELVDVISRYFAQLHAVDTLEGRPWFKALLLGKLLALLFHDFLILCYGPKQLKDFVLLRLC